ncbi:hypothetical protein Skr01_27820 [Sphaerisporangium krabiense]|uniref:Uncharacterized protein n=1 Tax=Sphaerisporangium krabiense TaxID=763782 RepID=A0A7W8ZAK7_9ACTN|nr:DUF6463 family protein [Sphaerisporangium krabiense]MBB5630350.1 hypothetical protein [Sphaerisporangium krabiense]GII62697.1 hypothetical protein Skr01_27820 [Sphaerisporangium krabiense]
MNSAKRLLHWASGIMVVLGTGHLALASLLTRQQITGWAERGLWATVPLLPTKEGAVQAVESLQSKAAFWGGPGCFSVPLILLGCLIWHLAGRGTALPARIGWALAAWGAVGGVLLVPSPFFALTASGVLIILAARSANRPGADRT